jgi:hypothetical protein
MCHSGTLFRNAYGFDTFGLKPLFMRLNCWSITSACEVYLGNMGLGPAKNAGRRRRCLQIPEKQNIAAQNEPESTPSWKKTDGGRKKRLENL